MNIIDAIKSGRPFRRKGWAYWVSADDAPFGKLKTAGGEWRGPWIADILADDWETKPEEHVYAGHCWCGQYSPPPLGSERNRSERDRYS